MTRVLIFVFGLGVAIQAITYATSEIEAPALEIGGA